MCWAPSKWACRFSGEVVVMPQARQTYTSPAPTDAAPPGPAWAAAAPSLSSSAAARVPGLPGWLPAPSTESSASIACAAPARAP